MARTDRLFELIQLLRSSRTVRTAAMLAESLEVSVRTIYRDISLLQSLRVPIEGEAGIGYLMRNGYDLPPLMFTAEEREAIGFGLALISQRGDKPMRKAASSAMGKIENVLPDHARPNAAPGTVLFYQNDVCHTHLDRIRAAIRSPRYLDMVYEAADGEVSKRTIAPLALIFFANATVAAAWCTLRGDFRHFRVDRVLSVTDGDAIAPAVWRECLADWRASEARALEQISVIAMERIFEPPQAMSHQF